eukprot:1265306-Amorphochlora_amoeboformis.AAC.1
MDRVQADRGGLTLRGLLKDAEVALGFAGEAMEARGFRLLRGDFRGDFRGDLDAFIKAACAAASAAAFAFAVGER